MHKSTTIIFSFILLCCSVATTFAQTDSAILDGKITVNKTEIYKYKIVAGDNKGKWIGYSILDEGGENETKTSVSIEFSKEKSSMIFSEKKFISSKSKEKNFCFIGGVLQLNAKNNEAKGFFLGKDEKNALCGKGSIKLSANAKAKKLMTSDGTIDTNIRSIITGNHSEHYAVKNELITLELWDGGVNDHDSVTVYLNGALLVQPLELLNEKKTITIRLKKGENILKIKALNEGLEAPNSAQINVVDQEKHYKIISFLKTSEEAVIKLKL